MINLILSLIHRYIIRDLYDASDDDALAEMVFRVKCVRREKCESEFASSHTEFSEQGATERKKNNKRND